MRENGNRILGHTANVAAMTLVSRLLGYVRDRVLAGLLGTSYWADAFYIAFRIPNTFRRFVAEGAMTAALVPVLSESFEADDKERSWLFARRFLYVFGVFLVIFGLVGSLAAPVIVKLMAWELAQKAPQVYVLTRHLTALLFPYITLISLSAVAMGILNCRDVFALPALTPAFLNVTIVVFAIVWGYHSNNPTEVLAYGVLTGGLIQFVVQIPLLKKEGMSFRPAFTLRDERVMRVFKLMVPGILGAGAGQLTILVGTALAHMVGEGAVSALYYANRVTELAFGLFAVSLSTVILPSLSRQVADGDKPGLESILSRGLSGVIFVILPASAGILALSGPIVNVLFRTGRFSSESVALTVGPLIAYALGMVPWAAALILVRVCHAHQDMTTPLWAGMASLVVFTASALYLMGPAGATGIALASSISALVNGAWLAVGLRRKHGVRVPLGALSPVAFRILLLSVGMGFVAWWLEQSLPHGRMFINAFSLFVAIGAGVVIYAMGAWILRFPEARFFGDILMKRLRGR
jgi:putative peptidoglycan lipid II flippase